MERVEVPVLPPDQLERLEAAIASRQEISHTVLTLLQDVQTALRTVKPIPLATVTPVVAKVPLNTTVVETEPTQAVAEAPAESDRLSALEQRILNAIAMFEAVY